MTIENTTISASFQNEVRVLGNSATQTATKAHAVGVIAVHKAYGGNDLTYAQYVLDNAPKYVAKALTTWFKRAGLDILEPSVGSTKYTVVSIIDKSRQAKVFTAIKTRPVIDTVMTEKVAPKAKVLKGTPQERAQSAVDRVINSLKKSNDDMAAGIVAARTAEAFETMSLITADGCALLLEQDEYNAVIDLLASRGRFVATNLVPEQLAA